VGHTLAASGLMETSLLLNHLKAGIIPGIINRTEEDHVFLSYDAPAREGVIAVLAAGMGNVFSAALFDPC
jgi:3-oxoacyl-(acyl-carrier-protein) synthase